MILRFYNKIIKIAQKVCGTAGLVGFYVLNLTGCLSLNNPVIKKITGATSGSSSSGSTAAPTVTITTPSANGRLVVQNNYTAFTVSGACTTGAGNVSLSVATTTVTGSAACVAGAWTTTLDFTAPADATYTITASQTLNGATGSATRTVNRSVSYCITHLADADLTTSGAGTIGSPYLICNANQFVDINNRLAGGSSQYFELRNNITVAAGIATMGILDQSDTLNGNYLTVDGVTITSGAWNVALFESMTDTSRIENITFTNMSTSVSAGGPVGLLVAEISSGSPVLDGITLTGTVTSDPGGFTAVGSIIGSASGTVTLQNCSITATVSAPTTNKVGGIMGADGGGITISNCTATTTVTGAGKVGGATGESNAGSVYTNITLSTTIVATGDEIGGFTGRAQSMTYNNCRVSGSITHNNVASATRFIAGFVGMSGGTYTECGTSVSITATTSSGVGGFTAFGQGDFTRCYSTGTVTALSDSSAFINNSWSAGPASSITDSYSLSDVTVSAATGITAGLVGGLNGGTITATRSYYGGTLTGGATLYGVSPTIAGITTSDTYWNSTKNPTAAVGEGTSLTNVQMQFDTNFTGFVFPTTWIMDPAISVYPVLLWQQ